MVGGLLRAAAMTAKPSPAGFALDARPVLLGR